MRKYIVISLFVIGAVLKVQAQDYDRQIGIDGNQFLSQFFNFGGSVNNFSSYFLTLRKLGETHNRRFGFGANLAFNSNDVASSSSINVRFGKERFKDFGKIDQWRAFYSLDHKVGLDIFINNGDNNRANLRFGVAPVVGLQFRINDRISLSTEAAFNFWLSGGFARDNNVISFNTSFEPPLSLFVQYDFKKKEKETKEKI